MRPGDATLLFSPNISVNGLIEEQTLPFFLDRLQAVRDGTDDLILELNTQGGTADIARRIGLEIRMFVRHSGRRACCVGKTNVYSAGITILAAFPKECRFLTDDAVLLIHERRLEQSVQLTGPIKSCLQIVREQLSMLETAEMLETEGFREFVEGSNMTLEQLLEEAKKSFYVTAEQALKLGLVAEILR
jgi:ATP-dependent protease ClpP protease subunit